MTFAKASVCVLVLCCSGCGGSGLGPSSPLAILSIDPDKGATNVPLSVCPTPSGLCGGTITVIFSKPIEVTQGLFELRVNGSPSVIAGNVECPGASSGAGTCSSSSQTILFVTATTLLPDSTYQATLGGTNIPSIITDINGVPLAGQPIVWTFTTAAH
jgi:hypothetical protein